MNNFSTFNSNVTDQSLTKKNKLILVASHIISFGIGSMIMHLFMKNYMC